MQDSQAAQRHPAPYWQIAVAPRKGCLQASHGESMSFKGNAYERRHRFLSLIFFLQLQTTGNIDADSSMILVRTLCFRHLDRDWTFVCVQEMMSERSIQLLSQAQGAGNISIDSSKGSIAPWGLSQAESHAKMKPRFVEFSCSYVEVRWVGHVATKSYPTL